MKFMSCAGRKKESKTHRVALITLFKEDQNALIIYSSIFTVKKVHATVSVAGK